MELKTVITGIKKDISKNGKPFYRVTLQDGTQAFAWNWQSIANAEVNKPVVLEVEKQGRWLYVTGSQEADEEYGDGDPGVDVNKDNTYQDYKYYKDPMGRPPLNQGSSPVDNPETIKTSPEKISTVEAGDIGLRDHKDIATTRMGCLKRAIEYAVACTNTSLTENEIIDSAIRFEKFVYTGK